MNEIKRILIYNQKIDYMKNYDELINIFELKFSKECQINNKIKYKNLLSTCISVSLAYFNEIIYEEIFYNSVCLMLYFFFVDDYIVKDPAIYKCVLSDCEGCTTSCQDIYILKKQYEKNMNTINKNYLNKSMLEWIYSLELESHIRVNKDKIKLTNYLKMRLITVGALPCFKFIDIYSCKNVYMLDQGYEYFTFINHCILTIIIINDLVSIAKEQEEKDNINIFNCLEYSNMSWKEKFFKAQKLLEYHYNEAQKLSNILILSTSSETKKCIYNYLKLTTNNIDWHMIAERYLEHKNFWKQIYTEI